MKIGFMGTGLMGAPMVERLLDNGMSVTVYNRTQEKIKPIIEKYGAEKVTIAPSPDKLLGSVDCLILMLTNAQAIHNLILSPDSRHQITLSHPTIIQMGTITPTESKEIQSEIVKLGGKYIEAPVLGSIPEAKSGNLIVMIGAQETDYLEESQNYLPLLKNFSSDPIYIGEVGTAAALKLALNQLIASLTTSFALSLAFVQNYGAKVDDFMAILRKSALYAPTFDKKLQRMLDGNYANPNFPTKHLLKDTGLFINEAKSSGLNISSVEGVEKILNKAMEMALADEDYSSLFEAIKK
jgi:3-hydroxyisobutyrate dehydrogenase